jgi:hypothetical protein
MPGLYRSGLPRKNEKSCLKCIFGVVVVQQPATYPPHHRAVSVDQGSEGRLVVTFDERGKELPVGQVSYRRLPGPLHSVTDLGHVSALSSINYPPLDVVLIHEISSGGTAVTQVFSRKAQGAVAERHSLPESRVAFMPTLAGQDAPLTGAPSPGKMRP